MKRYNPSEIEPKWQKIWDETQIYKADLTSDKPKYIAMSMFNYPSGAGIHIGHSMNYTISDVMARYKRQQGYESYHPVGWDSFGLPAENYAIKTGVSPQKSMAQIIPDYHRQYKAMGWSNDWSKEIATHEPIYYKWTQWIFTQMYKHDMAYQDSRMQWWCDIDKTVLSNEQVIDGKCWRHDGANDPLVEKKEIKQWFFKITDYAEEMLDATDALDWTESVKLAQKNWIGKSVGAEIDFKIASDRSLKFIAKWQKDILSGFKNVTFRQKDQDLKSGDVFELIADDSGVSFATGVIKSVEKRKLRDIALDDPRHEKYATREEMINKWNEYHRADLSENSDFWIYSYEILPPITVFSTRPDTLFGATFLVMAPEHEQLMDIVEPECLDAVNAYIKSTAQKTEVERQSDKEKTGVFTGRFAINPINGAKIPIWVADYVLAGYGTGAIMAVPAHDERDYEFAEKFELPIIKVVEKPADDSEIGLYTGEGPLVNSGEYNEMRSEEAREQIVAWLEQQNLGQSKTTFKIRDWSVSRQRYWGAPIPIINCPKCGPVLVPDDQLPVVLPELTDYAPSGDGRSALARATQWLEVDCPKCGGKAERETDTLDTYICSSWYMLRYFDPKNENKIFDSQIVNKWMPIDFYNGGDHATAHMIYARFITRFLSKLGYVDNPEPFKKFLFNGKVTASDGTMFSKSKGTGVDPLEIINSGYGADALRTYLMFAAPLDQWMRWDSKGVPGTYRFLSRVWNLVQEFLEKPSDKSDDAVLKIIHPTILKVTRDLEDQKYNTAIASMMKATNELYDLRSKNGFADKDNWQFALESLVSLVAPFAPHIADELWQQLGHGDSVNVDHWPVWDDQYLVSESMVIAVQVNGKLRGEITVAKGADEDSIKADALGHENVSKFVADKKPTKVIYVPGRLVSIVVN